MCSELGSDSCYQRNGWLDCFCLQFLFVLFFKEKNTTAITFQVEEILTVKSRWEEAFEANREHLIHT